MTRSPVSQALVLCALSLSPASLSASPAQAQSPSMDEMVASPAVWRGFRPFVIAAGAGDRERAARYLRAGNEILRKADVLLERDPTALAFQEAAHECMQDFDLKSFLKLLPEQAGAFRYFGYAGAPTKAAYRVWAARGKDFEVGAHTKRRGFGESSGVLSMRKLEHDDSQRYIVRFRTGAGVGDVAWSSILDGASDGLAILDEPAGDEDRPTVLRAAESFLRKRQPRLSAEDLRVMATFWGSFPQVSELLSGLGSADDLIAKVDPETGVTHVRAVSRWEEGRIKRRYPELADYFSDLDKLLETSMRVSDAKGRTLFKLSADTERLRSQVEFFVKAGRIVPSKGKKPLPDEAPHFERMRVHASFHFQAFRLHFRVRDFTTELRYRETPRGAELTGQSLSVPKVSVSGAAFGLFPAGMLDWFIPGDMESLTRSFFKAAVEGNEGRGIEWRLRFDRSDEGLAVVDGRIGLEVLDSALIRMGMALAADKVVPDDDQLEDMRKLAADYRAAFDKDVARFAAYGN